MNFERIKSFLLVILIGTSLLLTLGLWSTSPGGEEVHNSSKVKEVDVGGVELQPQDIIHPSQITLHETEKIYNFKTPEKLNYFFQKTNEWEVEILEKRRIDDITRQKYYVAIHFPVDIPFDFLQYLYKFKGDFTSYHWSVKTIYLLPHEQTKTVDIQFVSSDGSEKADGMIDDHKAYETLTTYFAKSKDLSTCKPLANKENEICLDTEKLEMRYWVLGVQKIEERLFVNALFNNPSAVGKNIGEGSYLDGQRALKISPNRRSMEYINPQHDTEEKMTSLELIENSLEHINEHKGWTGTYKLSNIHLGSESIQFQLYYEGYPVFNIKGLATFEQRWRNKELYNYKRPLFKLMTPLTDELITLPSAVKVYEYLQQKEDFDIENIEDLQPAYRLDYHDDYSSITLSPTWYILDKGSWREIPLEDFDQEGV